MPYYSTIKDLNDLSQTEKNILEHENEILEDAQRIFGTKDNTYNIQINFDGGTSHFGETTYDSTSNAAIIKLPAMNLLAMGVNLLAHEIIHALRIIRVNARNHCLYLEEGIAVWFGYYYSNKKFPSYPITHEHVYGCNNVNQDMAKYFLAYKSYELIHQINDHLIKDILNADQTKRISGIDESNLNDGGIHIATLRRLLTTKFYIDKPLPDDV